jgi:hypothetical protein
MFWIMTNLMGEVYVYDMRLRFNVKVYC